MTGEVASRCELLPWDSEHFGFTIARLETGPLTEEDAIEVDAWCAQAGVRCLYFEAPSDDLPTSLTPGLGRIGLVGAGAEARGRGVARALVLAALSWFRSRGSERVQVTTQGRNIAAQRLYQRCGFLTHSVSLYYHKWYS